LGSSPRRANKKGGGHSPSYDERDGGGEKGRGVKNSPRCFKRRATVVLAVGWERSNKKLNGVNHLRKVGRQGSQKKLGMLDMRHDRNTPGLIRKN